MDKRFDKVGEITIRTMEECAELIHILCKVNRFGWSNYHPEDAAKIPNVLLVVNEILDLERRLLELKRELKKYGVSNSQLEESQNTDTQQANDKIKPCSNIECTCYNSDEEDGCNCLCYNLYDMERCKDYSV